MPYMTYSQFRKSAKARLAPFTGKLAGVAAMQIGFTIIISQVSSVFTFFATAPALQFLLYILFAVISGTLTGLLNAGIHYLFLKLYCGRPFSAGDLFYAFKNQTKTCALLAFALSLITTVPSLPAYYFSLRFAAVLEDFSASMLTSPAAAATATLPPEAMNDLTLMLFCYTPALIVTTLLGLVYSQAYYLILDFPSCSAREALRKSRLLMRGHKGRLFYIQVCFLPLLLLGTLTCGIGMLWIAPFLNAVQTEFYLDLVTKRSLQNQSFRRA